MLEMAWHAGEEGIQKHRMCRRLGVSMKKMKNRMDDVKKRFGILETDDQDGKQVCSGLHALICRLASDSQQPYLQSCHCGGGS